MVYLLGLTLNPTLLIGKVFFQSDALSRGMKGRFYEIGQVRQRMVIAVRSCQVHRIFAFKQSWLKEYYFDPINRLQQRFRRQPQRPSRSCVVS